MTMLKVKIADYQITTAPNSLMTIGLGSCVGVALYEKETKKGSLLHIMLPDSTRFKDASQWQKYADKAIPKVAAELSEDQPQKLVAKLAGGANMFQFSASSSLQIGKRNIRMVKKTLAELDIPIIGEHLGGNSGRTMKVDLNTFDVTIRMVNRDIYQI